MKYFYEIFIIIIFKLTKPCPPNFKNGLNYGTQRRAFVLLPQCELIPPSGIQSRNHRTLQSPMHSK